ncbi:MAG: hypothetical protein ACI9XO_003388 [Paraglaciecola sp.]|jgi:uncharacterized protein (UPF0332 family)
MKEQYEKREYIAFKVKKAEETLEAALLMNDNKMWSSAINRLYYAAFYAVSGLLLTLNLKPKSHAGVRMLFFENFFKNNKLDAD